MKHISTIFTLALAASALLLSSCAKDLGGNGSANGADSTPLSFSTSTEGTLDVKGSFATEVTSFTAAGYDGSSPWFSATAVNTTDKYSTHKWVSGKSYTFYGYANMPSSASTAEASITKDGVSLNYKAVPTDASAQNDILLGHYSGNGGGTGTAAMTFYHPLASVVFTVGEIEGISEITSISIKGVYSTGKVGFSVSGSTPAYIWSDCSGSTTVSQTITGDLPAKDAQLGEPFILIPQTFTSLKIQMSATTTAGEDQVIISELTGIALEAGKKTVLSVSYSAQHGLNFTSSLIAWNNTAEQEMDLETAPPDPRYWVDLGAVTADGHKLYFAKYNVASIDENGNAIFADTPEEPGGTFTAEQAAAIKTAGGQKCRLPTHTEFASTCIGFNTTYSFSNYVATLTGNLEGYTDKSMSFYSNETAFDDIYYLTTDGNNFRIFYSSGRDWAVGGASTASGHIRLVTILEETVESSDVELYLRNGMYDFINRDFDLVTLPTTYVFHGGWEYKFEAAAKFDNGFRYFDRSEILYEIYLDGKKTSGRFFIEYYDHTGEIRDKSTGVTIKSFSMYGLDT